MADLALSMLRLRSSLTCCKTTSDGLTARCPCHDDRVASLSVTRKHDRILVHCFAGCDPRAIVERVGLEWGDLYADGVEAQRRKFNVRPTRPTPTPKAEDPPPDFGPLLKAARALPNHRQRLLALADELGVLHDSREAYADAAEAVGVVWLPKAPSLSRHLPNKGRGWKACWGVPERDDVGNVIGISRRYPGGQKRSYPGGKRGLTYAPALLAGDGPVLLPEGASDVIALLAANVRAIGRPSNVGGVDLLSALISTLPAGESVVVVGENDGKVNADGKLISPGREGMDRTAEKLARSLPSHRIAKALPPAESKDSRAALRGRSGAEVGLLLLASMTLQACPCIPIRDDQKKAGECTDNAPADPLAGLPDPPPACACRRGGASFLQHASDVHRHRAVRHACDSWHCPVCRERNAHQWTTHLAGCAERAEQEGCALHQIEATRDRFDGCLSKAIRRQHTDWCALELAPGVLLVVMAIPVSGTAPPGCEPVTFAELCARMIVWAKEVRNDPEPFSSKRKKARPVRTSRGWQLNRAEPTGEWVQVAQIDTLEPDAVAQVVRKEGGRLTCDNSEPGDRRDSGSSLVWKIEWRADPEVQKRIAAGLRALDERPAPPPPGGKKRAEDDPDSGWTPFGGGS